MVLAGMCFGRNVFGGNVFGGNGFGGDGVWWECVCWEGVRRQFLAVRLLSGLGVSGWFVVMIWLVFFFVGERFEDLDLLEEKKKYVVKPDMLF